ncbi:DUF4190 domain-containing protein [Cellulomonas sp. URHD0024]|uniref:DUF4190 domain-containing protein n=1 Tax=Cellulomonas sp. URHD0024 TaxID=1302620 RepID=UPI000420E496|nr:DUF4190 domain-containing protein [Cellulomonas sp. URHD0024]
MPDLPEPSRTYRDTEPLAVWGFVLTFLFWPAGLVLSYVALRRVRRTGDGGWGLAVAGAALSTIAAAVTVVAGLTLFARSDLPDQWSAQAAARADASTTRRVIKDVESDLLAQKKSDDAWPTDVGDGSDDGVRVAVYRTGDTLCVEGSRGVYHASVLGGDVDAGVDCATRGVEVPFLSAAISDAHDAEAARQATLVDDLRGRAQVIAEKSSVDGTPDLGISRSRPADLELCSAMTDMWHHLDDPAAREAFWILTRDSDAEMQIDPVYFEDFADIDRPADSSFAYGLLYAEADCWRGGFVGPSGEMPPLPSMWTQPTTQESFDADHARSDAAKAGDPAAVALSDQLGRQEEAQIAAAIAAHL